MADTVVYMYCVVPASFGAQLDVTGIAGAPVRLVPQGDVAALVSTLSAPPYTPETVGAYAGDIEWLKPHAVAHDLVVTWASDRAPVVPMPMWTLFADDSSVSAALQERYDTLLGNLATLRDAREYTVRIFADPAGVASALATLSPGIGELEKGVKQASPGQAYLLQRKIEEVRKRETRTVVHQVADEAYETLASCSVDAVREQLPKGGNAVLNASFLIANVSYDDLRSRLTALINRYQPAGFQFEFTGPWPAYHFIRER